MKIALISFIKYNILNPNNRPLVELPSCINKLSLTKHIGHIWWQPFSDIAV